MSWAILKNNWLVESIFIKEFQRISKQYAKGRLIDIGCGTKPLENILKPYITEHIGVDHEGCLHDKSKIDLSATAYSIPVEDSYFDTAICTAVLEHLEEPSEALSEMRRVLKQGGFAIYAVPLFWHIHEEPRDFYRFTKYGIKYLFQKNGFDLIELKPMSGFWVTFTTELTYYIWGLKKGPIKLFIPLFGALIQIAGFILNKIDRAENFTWMYMVVAQKK